MVVDDLNIRRPAFRPTEANAPLLVHSNAVLPFPVAFECLEPIAWRYTQIIEFCHRVYHHQLAMHDLLEILWQPPGYMPLINLFGFGIGETLNHRQVR